MGIKDLLEISNYYELLDKYSFNFKKTIFILIFSFKLYNYD